MNSGTNYFNVAVIYDDHLLFSQGFCRVLNDLVIFEEIVYFQSESLIVDFFLKNVDRKICLFLDFFIGKRDSLSLLSILRQIPIDFKVVVVSSVDSAAIVNKVLKANVDGFLSKMDDGDEIRDCISNLNKENIYISSSIKQIMLEDNAGFVIPSLTSREKEILSLLSSGKSTSQISFDLNLSIHTVMTHRKNIIFKMGVKSISHAISFAIRANIIEPGE